MKIYIWGTGVLAEECAADLISDVEIAGFVETVPQRETFCGQRVISGGELAGMDYDFVILANSHEEDILNDFALDLEKIIYYRMLVQWDSTHKVQFLRKNAAGIKNSLFQSQKKLEITEAARGIMPYISVEADGLKFLFDHNDNLIANDMLGYGKTYSRKEMHFFYKAAPQVNEGYFLDIGANVGTTSIYFRKNLCSTLKYIAFEPFRENYKVLKANCILNDCEDIETVNVGLSNMKGQRNMYIFDGAFGSSMVSAGSEATERCDFLPLDDYVRENNLSVEKIAYLWVDVQCHELEVVEGGIKTLSESPASLYIEFNIEDYRREEGKAERFLNLLAGIYKSFICYEQYEKGSVNIRDISELMLILEEIDMPFCNILFMK